MDLEKSDGIVQDLNLVGKNGGLVILSFILFDQRENEESSVRKKFIAFLENLSRIQNNRVPKVSRVLKEIRLARRELIGRDRAFVVDATEIVQEFKKDKKELEVDWDSLKNLVQDPSLTKHRIPDYHISYIIDGKILNKTGNLKNGLNINKGWIFWLKNIFN